MLYAFVQNIVLLVSIVHNEIKILDAMKYVRNAMRDCNEVLNDMVCYAMVCYDML